MAYDPATVCQIDSYSGKITVRKAINQQSTFFTKGEYRAEVLAITTGKKMEGC